MKAIRWRRKLVPCLASLGLCWLAGCQTWVPEAGLTLPSPSYLQHLPQYIPPSPPYPLTNELSGIEEAAARNAAAAGAGALPR